MIKFVLSVSHFIVVFVLARFYCSVSLTAAHPVISSDAQVKAYLQQYGYMDKSTSRLSSLVTAEAYSKAIKEFQNFAGLSETGELNNETLTMMNTPRCGVSDKAPGEQAETTANRTVQNYVHLGSKWRTKDLTYGVSKYSTVMKDKTKVDDEMAKAFKVWSDVSALKFTNKKTGAVDLNLRFEVRNHGDGDPFDGPGNVLAHAVDPKYGGDACFDDEETWTANQKSGINLFQVAAHEFGHSLGLGHSKVKTALMAPFYAGYQANFKLDKDDIKAIQALYGQPSTDSPNPSPTQTPDTSDAPDLCQDSAIDAATKTEDGRTYVFKGNYYWRILKNGMDQGYPKKISSDWVGLPGNLNAAVTWKNGRTYFFKGNQFWKFRNQKMERGYPKDISHGFPGIPNNIDAAFVWSKNSKTYFFKGGEYWRYESGNNPQVSSKYPKPMSNWEGLPQNINAALQWSDGKTYFFKNKGYYKYNDKTSSVDDSNPSYPRSTSMMWFGCSQSDIYEDLNKASLEEEDRKSIYVGNDREDHETTTAEADNAVESSVKQFMEDLQQYNRNPHYLDPGFGYSSSAKIISRSLDIFASFIVIFFVNTLRMRFM